MNTRRSLLATALALAATPAHAATEVRLSHGYGIHFLPMMVIRDRQLLEKHIARAGLPLPTLTWRTLDSGSTINDAMLSGALDIAGTGAPGFITLWSKARRTPASAVTGLCALGGGSQWLNTNNPAVKSLRDFTEHDKIAVPGIKTSFSAVMLEIAAAKEFGLDNYAKLDPITVSLPHPDAFAALVSGKTEITAHFSSPPFSIQELTHPGIHRVVSTMDLLGPITIDVAYAPQRFADANPGLVEAFLAAKDEADAMILHDRAAAAESFVRVSGVKMSPDVIGLMLDDPETTYTATPNGIMKYVEFLAHVGAIKTVPATWSELFVPQLRDRAGS